MIHVKNLSKPQNLLPVQSFDSTIEELLLLHNNIDKNSSKAENFPYGVVAKSKDTDSIVTFGFHPFFNGMYQAYADHRPFTLSPDIIWLLISQGFAQHINNNAEELRKLFVKHDGKISLIVEESDIILSDPHSPWEKALSKLTKKIAGNIDPEVVNILTCNFSTTTLDERIASQITVLETFKPYFEYILIGTICGIPQIRLTGTPDDWRKVYTKASALRKYDLDWWIDEIAPILDTIVEASKGDIDTIFWQNMFKHHSKENYGHPGVIDGWIVKFFPYSRTGKRNNLTSLTYDDKKLPNEMVQVDLLFIEKATVQKIPLELWAGFTGLTQNSKNFELTPQIGWFIRKASRDMSHEVFNDSDKDITVRVKYFPKELLSLNQFQFLRLYFTDTIDIPPEFSKIKVTQNLGITGCYPSDNIDSLLKLMPQCRYSIITDKLIINNFSGSCKIDTVGKKPEY